MKIKVCGMKYEDNIIEIAKLDPDFMGFIFYKKSKRFIANYTIIKNLLSDENQIKKVGVFVDHDIDDLINIHKLCKLDYIQLHGNESIEYITTLKSKGLKIIKAFNIDPNFDWNKLYDYAPFVNYFLFDTPSKGYGGSGKKYDWELLKSYQQNIPFFLSGGIGNNDLSEIKKLELPMLHAVDINSKMEIKAGLKDPVLVKDFINKLRNEH